MVQTARVASAESGRWKARGVRNAVLGPGGPQRLAGEEGSTHVWAPPGAALPDPAGRLDFDWRNGDVL